MDRTRSSVILTLVAVFVLFLLVAWVGPLINPGLKLGRTAMLRFVFVAVGLAIVFVVYRLTRSSGAWKTGTRQVVYMSIGAALYAVFSYIFNGSVFAVPSVSQIALRPAIAVPIFVGCTFGPLAGFFTGAVGNMFGDAVTGVALSPQWSVGNGLVGMIAGMVFLFEDEKRGMDTVLIIGAVLTALATAFCFIGRGTPNMTYFNPPANVFGDQPITPAAGLSMIIGFVLVLIVRFAFGRNIDLAASVAWGALGNLVGLGFAALSDIWINGYAPVVAVVGEYVPSAGPNLIFAAVLVPVLVTGYAAVSRKTGRRR